MMITLSVFALLIGASYPVLIISFGVAWAIGFFILRFFLKRSSTINSPNLLAAIIGFLMSPIILSLLIWALMAALN